MSKKKVHYPTLEIVITDALSFPGRDIVYVPELCKAICNAYWVRAFEAGYYRTLAKSVRINERLVMPTYMVLKKLGFESKQHNTSEIIISCFGTEITKGKSYWHRTGV